MKKKEFKKKMVKWDGSETSLDELDKALNEIVDYDFNHKQDNYNIEGPLIIHCGWEN